jgi:diguanylate cyclase (GGDEF)-like protein
MDVVQDNAAEDGWTIGYKGNYDRLYYVKKLNDSAIMVSAIYTSELADVFEKADRMEDMTIALIDQGEHMMYSSETSEIGNKIDVNIAKNLKANVSETVINREYLISEDTCENWRVICYIPTSSVMAEYSQLQMYILIISGIVIFLTLTIGIRLSSVVAHPISDMVKSLDKKASTDLLTLVLNKKSFEEQSENLLLNAAGSHYYAFMIIDVDDFKKVNDTNGHAFGDKVLENIAEMLRGTFWKNCLIGRLGGDEFAVLMSIPEEKNAEAKAYVDELVRYLYDRLSGWNRNYNDTAITLSSGIVLNQKQDDFKTIYKNADYALYQVKREGKNRFFIWDREESGTNDK